jgi:hypothetical protein
VRWRSGPSSGFDRGIQREVREEADRLAAFHE